MKKETKKELLETSTSLQFNELLEARQKQKKEDSDRYIQKQEEHKKASSENAKYSLRRFDVIIITLSSAGLASCMSWIKFFVEESLDPILLQYSFLCFGITLILNLISQITGFISNDTESKVANNEIRLERGKKEKENQQKLIKKSERISTVTDWLNYSCLLLFIIGLSLLIFLIFKI